MSLSLHNVRFTDAKDLSVELEYIIACNKIAGNELIKLSLENTDMLQKFKSAATRILKSIKKEGIIQLFVFENELTVTDKTESVYLLNKFPFLLEKSNESENVIYIKI